MPVSEELAQFVRRVLTDGTYAEAVDRIGRQDPDLATIRSGKLTPVPATVVGDATLFAVLTRQASEGLLRAAEAGELLTTSSWYYRLHRALHDPISAGPLSRMAGDLPRADRDALMRVLD